MPEEIMMRNSNTLSSRVTLTGWGTLQHFGKIPGCPPLFTIVESPGGGAWDVIGMDTHKTDARQSVLSSGDEVCHQSPEQGDDTGFTGTGICTGRF